MLKVLIMADSHGKVDINKFIKDIDCDMIVHLGDLNDYVPLCRPIYFINGNKEHFKKLAAFKKEKDTNFHFIQEGREYYKTDYEDSHIRFIGINGIVNENVFQATRQFTNINSLKKMFKHKYYKYIYGQQIRNIMMLRNSFDAVFSHDIPFLNRKDDEGKHIGKIPLGFLAAKITTKFWFHGHYHKRILEEKGNTTYIGVPPLYKGYCILNINDKDRNVVFKNLDKKYLYSKGFANVNYKHYG